MSMYRYHFTNLSLHLGNINCIYVSFLTALASANPCLWKHQALPFWGAKLTLPGSLGSVRRGWALQLESLAVLFPLWQHLLPTQLCRQPWLLRPILAPDLLSVVNCLAFLQQDLCPRTALYTHVFRINLETEHSISFKQKYSIILPQLINPGCVFCKISNPPTINEENSICSFLAEIRITKTQWWHSHFWWI